MLPYDISETLFAQMANNSQYPGIQVVVYKVIKIKNKKNLIN